MEARVFDAQVVLSPLDSPRGKLLSQYVCARIVRMDDIDLGLFDYDRNNTIYAFILNADEQIYMRYGGRDSMSPESYLDLNSLELALQQGLELHRRYLKGDLHPKPRPASLFPRQIPLLVERTLARGACVECHLIGDYQNIHREQDGTLDKLVYLFRSPDLKALGIELDIPQGLLVKQVRAAAQAAGMRPGDRITALNGTPVWTFGDLQYYYDKLDRSAQRVSMTVARGTDSADLAITLPQRWWWTDTTFRHFSIDPRVYFESRPLPETEKARLGLEPAGFASQVTSVDSFAADLLKSHQLRVGDIIFAVDGVNRDKSANTAELFIKLRKTAGESVTLDVIRDGKRLQMPLKTFRTSFRK